MAKCKWCDKRGLFLAIDRNGLCGNCQPHLMVILSRARVLEDSMRLAREGKTFATRLSRCELTLEHAKFLERFERKGVPTISPAPSTIVREFRNLHGSLIEEEAASVSMKAFSKAEIATSPKAKERALASGLLKVRELATLSEGCAAVRRTEQDLRNEIHRVTLEGFLDAARKAEFKGNTKKAIDQYQEALYFLRNDDVDDSIQASELLEVEAKLQELGGDGKAAGEPRL